MKKTLFISLLLVAGLTFAQDPAAPAPDAGTAQPAVEQPATPAVEQPAAPAPETPATPPADKPTDTDKKADEAKADDTKSATEGGKEKVSWSVGMGSVTVDGKQWNRLSLRPDIPIWKFGLCLDIEIFVDDSGNISDKGWKFNNAKNIFESISRKIYYLRFGHPGDKVYAKIGALDNVTLGYGLIMSGYANSLQYPDVKKMGLHFELNNIGTYGVGVQGVINNFQDFQRDGALIGTRLSVQPLLSTGIPILKNLAVGGSYVTDLNQRAAITDRDGDKVPDVLDKQPNDKNWAIDHPEFTLLDTTAPAIAGAVHIVDSAYQVINDSTVSKYRSYIEGKDPFSIAGADIGLPLINKKWLNLLVYGQWAMDVDSKDKYDSIKTTGWGIAAPGARFGLGPVVLTAEYRYFKDQFQGQYFDQTYELDRMKQIDSATLWAKERFLEKYANSTMSGVFSGIQMNLINILAAQATYQWMKVTYDKVDSLVEQPGTDQSISASVGLGETVRNVLRKVKIDDVNAYYLKKNIGTWVVDYTTEPVFDKFLEKTPFVLMGYKVGFQLSQSMILYWDTQYTYVLDETTDNQYDLKIKKRLNIETVMRF
ncbi:MAG: hypothetical protein V1913_16805 [Fibrobacterota bacterium]